MAPFKLVSSFAPSGDQPQAVREITEGLRKGVQWQTLLGVTGSGKTFTMANITAALNRPTLVISHNKTLAAQLYNEFKGFFPENAVEYFVSYYDYYQPEAYLPQTDTYIEKDSAINEEIDRLRLRATASLFERRDVLIVASVSCIYGLGNPWEYSKNVVKLDKGPVLGGRNQVLKKLIEVQYSRNDLEFGRGTFRVRGDVVDIHPAYDDRVLRLEFFGDEIERMSRLEAVSGKVMEAVESASIFPATHFVTGTGGTEAVVARIEAELAERLKVLRDADRLLEAQRLEMRTKYDIEMIQEIGYCSGIENYSRIFDGRAPGSRPYTLLDYFPQDFLVFIDESHVTVPQLRGMYNGDRARKEMLVEHGFRLPCALDNRPLRFEEFEAAVKAAVFVSATPADHELARSGGVVVEQLVRPTGILDPLIEVKPALNQVDDLAVQITERLKAGERVMITTLTKKMAEDLTAYLERLKFTVRYLHSDIDTLDRAEIIRDFRKGVFEVLVGINLLREGLDLPEVSLVAILDADKEGFLRSERSLVQTIGRASRNVNGKVILYADTLTDSMKKAIDETNRRRERQEKYNAEHHITPRTIIRKIEDALALTPKKGKLKTDKPWKRETDIAYLTDLMNHAAANLDFETAAQVRDRIRDLKQASLAE